jgi:uncharacterized membrane protein YqaE (UPF0057 family)
MLPTDEDFSRAPPPSAPLNFDGLEMLLLLLAAYFLPTILAAWRRHGSAPAITAVNILLGWTLLGWLWAFIWSLTQPRRA